jgi:hypothetical protein
LRLNCMYLSVSLRSQYTYRSGVSNTQRMSCSSGTQKRSVIESLDWFGRGDKQIKQQQVTELTLFSIHRFFLDSFSCYPYERASAVGEVSDIVAFIRNITRYLRGTYSTIVWCSGCGISLRPVRQESFIYWHRICLTNWLNSSVLRIIGVIVIGMDASRGNSQCRPCLVHGIIRYLSHRVNGPC